MATDLNRLWTDSLLVADTATITRLLFSTPDRDAGVHRLASIQIDIETAKIANLEIQLTNYLGPSWWLNLSSISFCLLKCLEEGQEGRKKWMDMFKLLVSVRWSRNNVLIFLHSSAHPQTFSTKSMPMETLCYTFQPCCRQQCAQIFFAIDNATALVAILFIWLLRTSRTQW